MMKIKGTKIGAALLCGALMGVAVWLAPGLAEAAPVTFQIDNGTQSGFQYSLIHSADGAPMNVGGVNYYASGAFGPSLYGTQMTGSLSGDMTTVGSLLQWTGITGTLLSNNGSTLTITGGDLSRQTTGSNQNAFGSFSYSLTGPGGASAGVFHFHPNQFTGPPGPNSLTETEFFLWGNNWNNGVEALPGAGRLGIDLHAVAPVPLPGALLFFGSGLMGMLGFRKTCQVI